MNRDKELAEILLGSPLLKTIFSRSEEIKLNNWYVAGGCVTQTVWNQRMGLDPLYGLRDVDLIYFDEDEDAPGEAKNQKRIADLFSDLTIGVDTKNQALVHTWYSRKFGYSIPAYKSTEDGIKTWLSAFAVGVQPSTGELKIFAPFGLEDLFSMKIKPNRVQITEEIYSDMCRKFKARWPSADIEPWK
jgi:hypothetical protein